MRSYRQRMKRRGVPNVDVTPFLSLMVILVPFLLISAVFSRITILELEATSQQAGGFQPEDPLQLQLVVRESVIEVRFLGLEEAVRITRSGDSGEMAALARLMDELKQSHPQSTHASILLEPQISYDILVQVMDRVRVKQIGGERPEKVPLFPSIALAETPVVEPSGRSEK